MLVDETLHVLKPLIGRIPKVPSFPLCRIVIIPNAWATQNYSVVVDLVQSTVLMSIMEVLMKFPSQCKPLLSLLN